MTGVTCDNMPQDEEAPLLKLSLAAILWDWPRVSLDLNGP
jgi:hypothetical protein